MVDALSGKVDVLIDGGVVISMDDQRRIFNPGFVAVDKGKIVAVGPSNQGSHEGRERLDASEMVVMPGIVNAHDHLDQSVYRSLLDHKRVSRDNLLNLARGLTRERAHAAAASSLLELLRYGVTTTQENHWTHYHQDSTDGICEAIQQSGMRAVVSRGISDEEEFYSRRLRRADGGRAGRPGSIRGGLRFGPDNDNVGADDDCPVQAGNGAGHA